MKILLLEPDYDLGQGLIETMNSHRHTIEVKHLLKEEEIFQEVSFLHEYSLFILNLKDPTDTRAKRHLRKNGGIAPILLILEKTIDPKMLQNVYYLSYAHIIYKDFCYSEIIFPIYKLCNVWNDDIFFLSKTSYFDFKNLIFISDENEVYLGKKEALLLKFLFLKSPYPVSHDEIVYYVYDNEIVTQESVRSLVRYLRQKLPSEMIETVKGCGYRLLYYNSDAHNVLNMKSNDNKNE
ncbi:winged helix-turn-helix domain-containing protein [Sulfurospirillum arcachonense]|uniref:winged helix-turn-helix domain-containing protein n=1 Tax=Sulfurospirillum arcachonense TaxID=57666 RepID=UPI000469BCDC|nr:winged helix-turn-helix domain-containing protein [Sulfurospirillum arcachonense]